MKRLETERRKKNRVAAVFWVDVGRLRGNPWADNSRYLPPFSDLANEN